MVIDGDNLVITVPGTDGSDARSLGQTARLFIRPVIGQPIPVEAINNPPAPPPGATRRVHPGRTSGRTSGAPPGAPADGPPPAPEAPPPPGSRAPPAPESPAPQPRPFPQEPTRPRHPATRRAVTGPGPADPAAWPARRGQGPASRIKFEKELRQSTNQSLLVLSVK